MPLAPLRRAFDENDLPGLHRVERAGSNLAGLVGKLGAELAILGDVQILQRARPHRGRDANGASCC